MLFNPLKAFRTWLLQPVTARLDYQNATLLALVEQGTRIMAQIDDLNTSLDALAATQADQFAAVTTELQQLQDAINAGNAVDLTAVIARIDAMKQATADSLAALQSDDPATPPPTP